MRGFPKGFYACLIVILFVTYTSGIALIPHVIDIRLMLEMPELIPFEWNRSLIALHGILAFLCALLLGSVWAIHMRMWWKKGIHRISGALLSICLLLLILTGVGIHYLGDESLILMASLSHSSIGYIASFVTLAHIMFKNVIKTPISTNDIKNTN